MNTQLNKFNRFLKLLWLIPVIALGYIGWVNIMPFGGTLHYSIDVGGQDTEGTARLTGPFDRISDRLEAGGETFRELEQSLVYFELDEPQLRNAQKITVRVRFKDNFNTDAEFVIGARNGQEWSYHWKNIYVPFYTELSWLPIVTTNGDIYVYSTDPVNVPEFASVDEFLQNPPVDSVIATNDDSLPINQLVGPPYNESYESVTVKSSLRGPHTLWTYVRNDSLELKIAKQDLNWYEEADELVIGVYSLNGELIEEAVIPDDGDTEESKKLGPVQETAFTANIPEPGAYRIQLNCNSDLLITSLEINQSKLVVEKRMYLSGKNPAYYPDETDNEPVILYGRNYEASQVRLYTWHNSGLQTIPIVGDNDNITVDVDQVKTDFYTDISPGAYHMTIPEQDILIDSTGFLAFTPTSYFLPRKCEVVELQHDMSWLVENVDYIVLNRADYITPENDDGWLIARTKWQLEDLYLIDNTLSLCLNVPHLARQPERTIRIDWIEIDMEISPLWDR